MAVPRSDQENDFMASQALGSTVWIACSDRKQEGDWKCEGSHDWNYTNWGSGQPDNYDRHEHCAAIRSSDKKWNDFGCNTKLLAMSPRFVFLLAFAILLSWGLCSFVSCNRRHGLCIDPWKKWGRFCYLLTKQPNSFDDARHTCRKLGAKMAVPRSDQENDFMASHALGSTVWIACSDRKQEGDWKCEGSGERNYTNWGSGQPDNYDRQEDCATMRSSDKKWNDRRCNTKLLAVCKEQPRIQCFTANSEGRLEFNSCIWPRNVEAICQAERPRWNPNGHSHKRQSLKASSSIAANMMEKKVGASTQPCFTPLFTWKGPRRNRPLGLELACRTMFLMTFLVSLLGDDPGEDLPSDAQKRYPAVIVTGSLVSFPLVDVHYGCIKQPHSYDDASQACRKLGAKMAVRRSDQENNLMASQALGSTVWVACSDRKQEGDWKCEGSHDWNYTNWRSAPWKKWGRSCYLLTKQPLSYDDARQTCRKLGAKMAVPRSDQENDFMPLSYGNARQACRELGAKMAVPRSENDFNKPLSYGNAHQACRELGAKMSVPRSDQENDFMASMVPGISIWVACSDRTQEGEWECEGSHRWNYTNWMIGQPDNYGMNEHCATIWLFYKKWNDYGCDNKLLAVCKQQPRIHCFTANSEGQLEADSCL
ncbi:C-type mannose receptor 2-like [Acanthaster planci]|uniref:C-type mannose receptor 2-like n=1 Tax=Acanthaster planci TaxID=133434 RepID=A0A8B7ZMV7_ACAPL|nr:C-type mannose receptor 2-like [Acanthaster planci]